jgi:hypothetical protein
MCSTCQKPITKNILWDVRGIVKRTEGGPDAASNLQKCTISIAVEICNTPKTKLGNQVWKDALVVEASAVCVGRRMHGS